MGQWVEYKDCCKRAASDSETLFCPECRHVLFRCEYPGCNNLVTPLGHCVVCLEPQLFLQEHAILSAGVKESLSIPFILKNNSAVGRPLSVRSVLKDDKDGKGQVVTLSWENLDPGRERTFSVATGPFASGGVNTLRLTIIVSSRSEDLEEVYAFSGEIKIQVEGEDATQIVQNINFSGANIGPAGMVVANSRLAESGSRQRQSLAGRQRVPLERAERYELQSGQRGYQSLNARVPRNVDFMFSGFPTIDKPPDGPLFGAQPILRCGRNSRTFNAQTNPQPNDLSLRVYDKNGTLDEKESSAISRRVCDFLLLNDRLCLRVVSEQGLKRNNEVVRPGNITGVNSGDLFSTPVDRNRNVTFSIKFKTSVDTITQIRIEKA